MKEKMNHPIARQITPIYNIIIDRSEQTCRIILDVSGMKNEWATVKDSKLYVGSHGKEMVTKDGKTITDRTLMWVKEIDKSGGIQHLNWTENYVKVRAAIDIHFPGYMTHEAVEWSSLRGRWYFLPRKASVDPFDPSTDEQKGTNILLSATPAFDDIKVLKYYNIPHLPII